MATAAPLRHARPRRSDQPGRQNADGLSPYAQCPSGSPEKCRFAENPQIALPVPELGGATVRVHRCAACGLGVTRPAMPDVSPLYEGRNSEDFQQRDSGFAMRVKEIAFRQMVRRLLGNLPRVPRRVVDYGCGNGVLTAAFASELPGANVVGLDFFATAPSGIAPAAYRSFGMAAPLHGKADLLLCFHALEHDDDPHAFMRNLMGYVAPGGLMVIEVPNVDCVWTPWFGAACNNWYLPYHRLHFSRQSLRALMETNGLKVLREENVCSATIAMSLSRWLGVRYNALFFLAGCAFRPIQFLAERFTRRPSALRIIVERR